MTKELSQILGDGKGYTKNYILPLTTSQIAQWLSLDPGLR